MGMSEPLYELAGTPGDVVARVRLRGYPLLLSPYLNRGTAFTLAEREALGPVLPERFPPGTPTSVPQPGFTLEGGDAPRF